MDAIVVKLGSVLSVDGHEVVVVGSDMNVRTDGIKGGLYLLDYMSYLKSKETEDINKKIVENMQGLADKLSKAVDQGHG